MFSEQGGRGQVRAIQSDQGQDPVRARRISRPGLPHILLQDGGQTVLQQQEMGAGYAVQLAGGDPKLCSNHPAFARTGSCCRGEKDVNRE